MSEEIDQDVHVPEQYTLGFNHAYAMGKDMPDLRKQMKSLENEPSDYMQGWDDGWRQYELDLRIDKIRQAQNDRSQSPDQSKDRGG